MRADRPEGALGQPSGQHLAQGPDAGGVVAEAPHIPILKACRMIHQVGHGNRFGEGGRT